MSKRAGDREIEGCITLVFTVLTLGIGLVLYEIFKSDPGRALKKLMPPALWGMQLSLHPCPNCQETIESGSARCFVCYEPLPHDWVGNTMLPEKPFELELWQIAAIVLGILLFIYLLFSVGTYY